MLNLIIKDILLQKKMIPFAIGYVVFFIFFCSENYQKGSVYAVAVSLAFIFSLGAMQYDERYKAYSIIASLPITRKEIVIGRYLGTIVFTFASTLFMGIFVWCLNLFNLMPGLKNINLLDVKNIIIISFVLMGIIIPLNYLLGTKKTRIVNVLIYITFFIALLNSFESTGFGNSMNFIIKYSLPLSIALIIISFISSLIIFERIDIG